MSREGARIRGTAVATALALLLGAAAEASAPRRPGRGDPDRSAARASDGRARQEAAPARDREREIPPQGLGTPEAETKAKRRKTLWIVAGVAAAAAVGLAAYFLLKKKKTADEPGPIPPDTGSLQVGSNPAGARIFLDGADTGRTTSALLSGVAVGAHTVRLVLDRYRDYQTSVTVEKDLTATVQAVLQPGGFGEDFNDGIADHWQPGQGTWTVSGGAYRSSASPPANFAASRYAFADFDDFSFEVRCRIIRPDAGSAREHGILFRAAADLSRYYVFFVNPGSQASGGPMWDVFEISNDQNTIQYVPWQNTTAVTEGWNTIKVTAQGQTFSFYANGSLLGSMTLPDPPARGRVGLCYQVDGNGSEVEFDDVVLTVPATAGGRSARLR